MFLLSVSAFAIRAVSFGLFMMALTPLVVLLVETGSPDTDEWLIAAARAALTTIGGLIAVGANFLLWPSREPDLLAAEVKNAIAAHGAYAEANFSVLLGETTPPSWVRRGGRLGCKQCAGGADHRALLEPGNKPGAPGGSDGRRCRAAPLRRTLGQCSARTGAGAARPTRDFDDLARMGRRLDASTGGRQHRSAPRPRWTAVETDALGRIARQIELMAGAMERLA